MKRILLAIGVLLPLLLLAGCAGGAPAGGTGVDSLALILDGTHTIHREDRVRGVLVALGGQTAIQPSAVVTGTIYVLGGTVQAEGEVAGDVTLLDGRLILGPQSHVRGNVNTGGGTLSRAPQATVDGMLNSGLGAGVPSPARLTAPSFADQALRFVLEALLLGGLALLLGRVAPRSVARVSDTVERHAIVAGAMGTLVGIVYPALLVLMAFTIILIPVTLLGVGLLVLAVAYGWIGFGLAIGRRLAAWRRRPLSPPRAALLGTLVFVTVRNVVGLIPVAGTAIVLILALVALGSVFLTRFGLAQFVPATELAADEPL